MSNPSDLPSKPTLIFRREDNTSQNHTITVNGTRLDMGNTLTCLEARYEGEEKRHILINSNGIEHIDAVLPPDLLPKGQANALKATGNGSGGSYAVIPNWRRL